MPKIKNSPVVKNQKFNFTARHLAVIGIIWLVLWFVLIVGFDFGSNLRAFYQQSSLFNGVDTLDLTNHTLRLLMIIGAFSVVIGLTLDEAKSEITQLVMILLFGSILSFLLIVALSFLNFALN